MAGRKIRRVRDDYPPNWKTIAEQVKARADYRCEACGSPHEARTGRHLTVDHWFNANKWNVEPFNLMALCLSCHGIRAGLRPPPMTRTECIRRIQVRKMEITKQRQEGHSEPRRATKGVLRVVCDGGHIIEVHGTLEQMLQQAFRFGYNLGSEGTIQ